MSSTQRILHVIAALDGYGLTRQLEMLAAAQVEAGHHVRVLALAAKRDPLARLRHLDIEARALDRRWHRHPFVSVLLAGELRRASADIVHAWDATAQNYLSVLRRMPGVNALPAETPVIATLAPPGIAPAQAPDQSRQEFLDEQQLPSESILITVAGPLVLDQQIDEPIWNFELVRIMDERARLLIFGDGPDRHRLERFARLTSDPAAIRFLGYRNDFRELLAYTDVFWHTHRSDQPLPLTVLEAMAAGAPTIANDNAKDGSGCRSILTEGETGYLVENNDRAVFARQTRKVVGDPLHAAQLGKQAAEEIAERHPIAAMIKENAKAYATPLVSSSLLASD